MHDACAVFLVFSISSLEAETWGICCKAFPLRSGNILMGHFNVDQNIVHQESVLAAGFRRLWYFKPIFPENEHN